MMQIRCIQSAVARIAGVLGAALSEPDVDIDHGTPVNFGNLKTPLNTETLNPKPCTSKPPEDLQAVTRYSNLCSTRFRTLIEP